MGLDMYLKKKLYVGAEYEHRKVAGVIYITVNGKQLPVNFGRVSEITENVAYWRKANHIHNWFVQNCQDGEDDCREAYVSNEKMVELLEECKKVLANKDKAPELMPTSKGFFFGGTEYGDYYFEQIEYTIKVIESLLEEKKEAGDFDLTYRSSW